MFGRHFGSHFEGKWAGRHGWRGHRGSGAGRGGRHGMGDLEGGDLGGGDFIRARRMLAQGDLRLIALALIAEQPRHGYEIIKLVEDKTAGWYSPSPGMVYPTLTYLEEAGYVTGQTEGARKLYSITPEGQSHLAENREIVDAVLNRFAAVGEKISRMRRRRERDDARAQSTPSLVQAALDNLAETVRQRLEQDAEAEPKVVELLARAANELKRG